MLEALHTKGWYITSLYEALSTITSIPVVVFADDANINRTRKPPNIGKSISRM